MFKTRSFITNSSLFYIVFKFERITDLQFFSDFSTKHFFLCVMSEKGMDFLERMQGIAHGFPIYAPSSSA